MQSEKCNLKTDVRTFINAIASKHYTVESKRDRDEYVDRALALPERGLGLR